MGQAMTELLDLPGETSFIVTSGTLGNKSNWVNELSSIQDLTIEHEQIDEHIIDCKEQFMGCLIEYKPKYIDYYKREVTKNKKITKQEREN
jgi:hypothetical protein